MGTKLLIYVLIFDVVLSLMVGAYGGIGAPTIPPQPTVGEAQVLAGSIIWSAGLPAITLIPSFSIAGSTFPGLTIPAITFFVISFGWLWPIILVFQWIAWVFSSIASVIGYILSIFTGSVSLLSGVPVLGPFLAVFTLLVNLVLVWEIIKLIRGYGP
jgi:hypothetical protein